METQWREIPHPWWESPFNQKQSSVEPALLALDAILKIIYTWLMLNKATVLSHVRGSWRNTVFRKSTAS
jgi:hypothetical protein